MSFGLYKCVFNRWYFMFFLKNIYYIAFISGLIIISLNETRIIDKKSSTKNIKNGYEHNKRLR